MKSEFSCVVNAVIYAVALNLILPMIAKPFATKDEINHPTVPPIYHLNHKLCTC